MSDRLIPILSLSCGGLVTLYIGLVVSTVFFATWQTQTVSSVRDTESAIGNLETNYYTTLTRVSAIDPHSVGYVSPSNVKYVVAVRNVSSGLTFAGN
ncbi:hypothetical protein H0X32_01335 [Patescibacteria group bacterium]|nr:hypothetical protein [Patescibacteria group bacterium]